MESRTVVGGFFLAIGLITAILVTIFSKNILDNFKKPVFLCLFQSGLSAIYLIPFHRSIRERIAANKYSKVSEEESSQEDDGGLKRRHIFMLTGLWVGGQLGICGALTLLSAPTANAIASLQSLLTLGFSWLLLEKADHPGIGSYKKLIVPFLLSTAGVLLIVMLEPASQTMVSSKTTMIADQQPSSYSHLVGTVKPPSIPQGAAALRNLLQQEEIVEAISESIPTVPIGVQIPVEEQPNLITSNNSLNHVKSTVVIRETITASSVAKTVLGSMLALGAAASSAMFSVFTAKLFSRKRNAKHTNITSEVLSAMKLYGYMGAIILAAAPVVLLLADISGFEDFQFFPKTIIPKILAITIFGNVLGAVSWCIGNILLNPVLTGVCSCLIVPGTLLCDILINHKHFNFLYYSAMVMVFVGATWVALSTAGPKEKSVTLPDESTALV